MALIELRIPRKRLKNVNVLRSEALLDLERQKQHELEIKLFREEERRMQRMLEEQRRLEEEEERRRQLERAELLARRPIFTEEYTISDKNQPLDISLSNVYELSLPIEEMRKEIQSAYDKGFKDGCD
ncbi:MAG: hypothetical protein QG635_2209, partial [Bacteroidota bacterium]|nr:hypothetical protein [Bacteroidota bacterium]